MELADQQNSENEGVVSGAEIPVETAAVEDKPLSLREQILKNVETVRTEEAKRARAADGKFTKLEAAAEKPAEPEIPKTEQNAQPEESNPAGPPSVWKGVWESMSPEARALAVKREADVEKGISEYRTKTAQLSEISQALEPLKPILQQSGIQTEAQAVKRLLEWEGSFRNPQTRMQAFQNLAQTYGVDLSTLVQNPSLAPSSAQDIPEPLRPVIDQFGNIQQQVQSVETRLQTWEQNQIAEKLTSFAKDKPHFEKVRVLMGQLMSSGIVSPGDLDTAYQKATHLHPEVSAAIEAEKAAKAAADLAKTNAERAARARQAAISPGQRSPTGAPANGAAAKTSSVRDSLLSSIGELREGQRA